MKKLITCIIISVALVCSTAYAGDKKADLSGLWYTPNPLALKAELDKYLDAARPEKIAGRIIGIIAPHAGFKFSGSVAAYGYKAAMDQRPDVVIVIGFSHRRLYPGIAVFGDDAFVTPLGRAVVDKPLTERIRSYSSEFFSYPPAFSGENSVEMEIPFIQRAFPEAKIVLLAIGDQTRENGKVLADALYSTLKDRKDFLIVGSTDMCHYLSYDAATRRDAETISIIRRFKPDELYDKSEFARHQLMCGFGATYATMLASQKLGANETVILKYANSGDTSGSKDRVVGYLSAAFVKSSGKKEGAPAKENAVRETQDVAHEKEEQMLDQAQREQLLKIARDTITHYLKTGETLDVGVEDDVLKEDMGAFVTLHKRGQLRGCIGNMVARGPLYLAVRDMAIAAAAQDPRFPCVTLDEMDEVDIEISALSPMRRISDPDEIEVGKHGVMVQMGWRSGVYLPQVADETGWTKEEFMNSLCAQKAGIPADAWKTGAADISIFTAEVFGEKDKEE